MPDGHSPPTPVVRHEGGRFGPGNPGRPSGARGRRGSHVVDAILDDFIANKDSALKSARFINGPAYLNTIVKLLPAQPSIGGPDVRGWSDAEMDEAHGRRPQGLRHRRRRPRSADTGRGGDGRPIASLSPRPPLLTVIYGEIGRTPPVGWPLRRAMEETMAAAESRIAAAAMLLRRHSHPPWGLLPPGEESVVSAGKPARR